MFLSNDREKGSCAKAFDVDDLVCAIFSGIGVVVIKAEGWRSCGGGDLDEG